MNDFYFIYFPIGYDFIKTMECTFKFIPQNTNVIVVTPHPELVTQRDYEFNLTVLKLDDIRDEWSKQNEYINYEVDQVKYREKLQEFQNRGIKFPYSIHRFIIPWLADRNITKFAILDADCLINYEGHLSSFFEYLENYCKDNQFLFGPILTEEFRKEYYLDLSREVIERYSIDPLIFEKSKVNQCFDGYLRGFWFNNVDDIRLFFNMWNDLLHKSYSTDSPYLKQNGHTVSDEWLFGLISYIFKYAKEVRIEDITWGGRRLVRHIYHPENYYNKFSHGLYSSYGLKHSADRGEFLRNNRENLIKFYREINGIVEENLPGVIFDYHDRHTAPLLFNYNVIHGRGLCGELISCHEERLKELKVEISEKLVVCTVLDRGFRELPMLRVSLSKDVKILEVDVYEKWITKVETLYTFLTAEYHNLPEYIMYLDGYDTMILKNILNPKEFLDFYGCKLLFSTEPYYAGTGYIPPYPSYLENYSICHRDYILLNKKKYGYPIDFGINAGVFLGEKDFLLNILEQALILMKDNVAKGFPYGCTDDQYVFRYLHNKYYDDIGGDVFNKFFFWGGSFSFNTTPGEEKYRIGYSHKFSDKYLKI